MTTFPFSLRLHREPRKIRCGLENYRRTRTVRDFLRNHKEVIVIAIFLIWISWIVYAIRSEKPTGAPSESALRDRLSSALLKSDADSLSGLFANDEIGDSYAKSYLRRLKAARAQGLHVTATESGGQQALVVSGEASDGQPICTAWEIKQEDKYWALSGAPSLRRWCPS
jgi:hypothetical protein